MGVEGNTMTQAAQRPGSYDEFVAARSAQLFRSAYLMTDNRTDAEDLLQTTLIKLYVGWRRAAGADSVEAYARRILVNTLISSRRPKRFTHERLLARPPDPVSTDADPEDRLAIWPHIVSLPARQRAVVVLRYYEELSEKEIAHALGCAAGTVKSTAAAALRTLKARMEEDR
jgi:RNA polymerase sigma-70 factor (sigma-E family)